MTRNTRPLTIVDILDTIPASDPHGVHVAKRVRINGTEVHVEAGTVELEFDANELTRVRLTLLPSEVHFIHAEPEKPEPETSILNHGDWVVALPDPHLVSGVGTRVPSTIPVGIPGEVKSIAYGNYYVEVNGERYNADRPSLQKVGYPPLKVGDTVIVPKGATYNIGGKRFVSGFTQGLAEGQTREGQIIKLADPQGNLVLNPGICLIHPDQVQR